MPSPSPSGKVAVYASVGPSLTHYEADIEACALRQMPGTVSVPENVQYAWPDAAGAYLYVASSNVAKNVKPAAPSHHRAAFRIDPDSGSLAPHGAPIPLPWRPVHLTLDQEGRHAIVVYPSPSRATVHRILGDGRFGDDVPQSADLETGVFPHQVRMLPSGRRVVIVTRGNNASAEKSEDPGALEIFQYHDGILKNEATVAPGGGYGFGPRHVDFDPAGHWLYAALERQNRLQVFKLDKDMPGASPQFERETLAEPQRVNTHQMVGTVHVHPVGKFIYVANRASDTIAFEGQRVFAGGENTLSVYAVDQQTGEPTLIQRAELHSYHVRTFAIDPSGRMLVAASISAINVRDGAGITSVPARLTTYRIAGDGKLSFANQYDVETSSDRRMFWMGMVRRGHMDGSR